MPGKILMIEDEPGLVITLSDRLEQNGYQVTVENRGDTGLERALAGGFDLILLDIMLPGMNGFDVCTSLRKKDKVTPVLMLTARGELEDKVRGLKIGADDYLTKPFEAAELLARIEALMRRAPIEQSGSGEELANFSFGNTEVDFAQAEVFYKGNKVEMSAREFHLLKYFIINEGKLHSRDSLLKEVWGYDSTPNTRTVDVHVAWLRQKLEPVPSHPKHILTVHGFGYKFQP
jgi:two-component system alkaline phosphatase synthesis response regulator PhoP